MAPGRLGRGWLPWSGILRTLQITLATLGVVLYVVVVTPVLSTISIVGTWFTPRSRLPWFMGRWWSWGILRAGGIRIESQFRSPLHPGGTYIYLANHQSYFDIPALLATVPGEIRFVAKQSLFRIPFFGWYLRAGGFIPVDRENRHQAPQAFASAAATVRLGRSVVFFPEGSRSPDGRLRPFERGGFLLALRLGLPIVPVGIQGARDVLPRGGRRIRPGRILVRYGEPIPVETYGLDRKEELMAAVRRQIAELAGVEEAPPAAE